MVLDVDTEQRETILQSFAFIEIRVHQRLTPASASPGTVGAYASSPDTLSRSISRADTMSWSETLFFLHLQGLVKLQL